MRVRPMTDFPERLSELGRVRISVSGSVTARSEWRRVLAAERQGDGTYVLTLDGVAGRVEALGMVGARVEIPLSEVRALPEGSYYRFELIGLEVRDEEGRSLGWVHDVIETGANDVFVVRPDGATRFADELLVPALKQVVLRVDPDEGVMVVRLLPGWDDK